MSLSNLVELVEALANTAGWRIEAPGARMGPRRNRLVLEWPDTPDGVDKARAVLAFVGKAPQPEEGG